jgi:hypothetical protein
VIHKTPVPRRQPRVPTPQPSSDTSKDGTSSATPRDRELLARKRRVKFALFGTWIAVGAWIVYANKTKKNNSDATNDSATSTT